MEATSATCLVVALSQVCCLPYDIPSWGSWHPFTLLLGQYMYLRLQETTCSYMCKH